MPREWTDVPLGTKLFLNVRESVLSRGLAALENAFVNEAGGHSAFPPMKLIHDFGKPINLYLSDWRGDLIIVDAVGTMHRMARNYAIEDITGIPISGGKRTTFAKTELGLVAAGGERIISLFGERTQVLSHDAPLSTHVVYLDGYLIAVEAGSGRFYHSRPGQYSRWDPLSVFTAEGTPDDLTCAIVTPYRELILGGLDSIEQFETFPDGDRPFFRRWATGEGVLAPYTLTHTDNASWVINGEAEWVRFSAQTSQPASADVGTTFEQIDNWDGAWAKRLHTRGQKFLLLQIPKARTPYEGVGLTFIHDYRTGRWASLYAFDENTGLPSLWYGSDIHVMREWGKLLVAGQGKIWEVIQEDDIAPHFPVASYGNDVLSRMYGRTGHIPDWGESRIDNLRMRLRRGFLHPRANDEHNKIRLRVNHDEKGFGSTIEKSLGKSGEKKSIVEFGPQGCGHTHQFEYSTFQSGVELVGVQVQLTPLGL